ncbi:hypothetical protein Bca4012_064362 [Brassica carinata]|uniref:Protein kinase domain-containing protein n=1 Tax=Brassica carinata TaxID=52824 RepID=A0A8X7SFM2_BRACI|nr:hypothetical protein Bca52824_033949 [Brassica carinata]
MANFFFPLLTTDINHLERLYLGCGIDRSITLELVNPFETPENVRDGIEEEIDRISAQEQKVFTLQALVSTTNDFNPTHKLGEGGFGPLFKGRLPDGRDVAVKKLSQASKQGNNEFVKEAKLLSKVQHRNVVNLWGYCTHGEDKLLVYEYVANESLDKVLFKSNRRSEIDWRLRFEIITGIARGLLYLHEDAPDCIIHRDIKAGNILLDDKWVPKIADFGMARLYQEDATHVNTRIAGTNGYMAPEYVMQGVLSVKADVFSFGVVVLELISGQKNSIFSMRHADQTLLEWAYKLYKKGRTMEILDSEISASSSTPTPTRTYATPQYFTTKTISLPPLTSALHTRKGKMLHKSLQIFRGNKSYSSIADCKECDHKESNSIVCRKRFPSVALFLSCLRGTGRLSLILYFDVLVLEFI